MWQDKLSYKITDKTLLNIVSLERNLAIIGQSEISFKSREKIHQEVLLDDLFSLSNTLGFNLSLTDVKKVILGKSIDSKEERILLNVRQVFDFIQNNYKKDKLTFNFHLVQHIIKLIHSDIFEVWDVGKIRSGNDLPEKQYELPNQKYLNQDIVNLLAESVVWVEEEENVHPIIKACVFMMFINSTSPFIGMNFISSLVFFRLILEKHGYGNGFTLPIFKIFTMQDKLIVDQINEVLAEESNISFSDVITSISHSLDEVIGKFRDDYIELDYSDIKENSKQLDLNERQIKLLKLLQEKVNIKRREYIKLFKVSPMTAYRDLNYLQEQKLLQITGEGKATTYILSSKA